jgi:hypothetical protein
MGMLHEAQYTFFITSQRFLEWEMFQTKALEKIKTHFMLNNFFAKMVLCVR